MLLEFVFENVVCADIIVALPFRVEIRWQTGCDWVPWPQRSRNDLHIGGKSNSSPYVSFRNKGQKIRLLELALEALFSLDLMRARSLNAPSSIM